MNKSLQFGRYLQLAEQDNIKTQFAVATGCQSVIGAIYFFAILTIIYLLLLYPKLMEKKTLMILKMQPLNCILQFHMGVPQTKLLAGHSFARKPTQSSIHVALTF